MPSNKTRIVVIGVGAVGATTAYTLLLRRRVDELVLIDANKAKAVGDALDMNHGMPFLGSAKIWAGDYPDCADADIIIITAGAAQKPGETRIFLPIFSLRSSTSTRTPALAGDRSTGERCNDGGGNSFCRSAG